MTAISANAAAEPAVDDSAWRRGLFWKSAQTLCRITMTQMFDLKVFGLENIPPQGGALLVGNHQSYLDPVLLAVRLPRTISFMAKFQLFEHPLFSRLIRELHAFPVRRGEGDISAIKEAIRRLRQGHMLTIFPEGTRSRDGQIQPIQPGISMLVRRGGVPVIPAVIDGAHLAWPRGAKLPRAHPIRILYGPPLQVAGLDAGEIPRVIERTFQSMMSTLRSENVTG